jgi:hypothetical protein
LKQQNLNPEIEEKLLNLQRYQEKQMKSDYPATPHSSHQYYEQEDVMAHHSYNHSYNQSYDDPDDDESDDPLTPQKSSIHSRKRKSELDDDEWRMDTPRKRTITKAYTSTTVTSHMQNENVNVAESLPAMRQSSSNNYKNTSYVASYTKQQEPVPVKTPKKSVYEKKKAATLKPNKLQVSNFFFCNSYLIFIFFY